MFLSKKHPIRKYVYFSDDAIKSMASGDEDMLQYYKEFLFDPERVLKMDVCLLTDSYFKPMTPEQEKFIRLSQETSLCKEVV